MLHRVRNELRKNHLHDLICTYIPTDPVLGRYCLRQGGKTRNAAPRAVMRALFRISSPILYLSFPPTSFSEEYSDSWSRATFANFPFSHSLSPFPFIALISSAMQIHLSFLSLRPRSEQSHRFHLLKTNNYTCDHFHFQLSSYS